MWFYEQMLFIFGNFRLKYFLDNDSYMTKKDGRKKKEELNPFSQILNIHCTLAIFFYE